MNLSQAQEWSEQTDYSDYWNGEWIAEGTLFQIAVSVEGGVMTVNQVESLGFEWSNDNGEVKGDIARVQVRYAGVSGIIQAELINASTAVVHAATCTPGYMVVCALARDRQAIFRKVDTD